MDSVSVPERLACPQQAPINFASRKLDGNRPKQRYDEREQTPATNTNKLLKYATAATAKPLQPINHNQNQGICHQEAWRLLQAIKGGKPVARPSPSLAERNATALALLERHFNRIKHIPNVASAGDCREPPATVHTTASAGALRGAIAPPSRQQQHPVLASVPVTVAPAPVAVAPAATAPPSYKTVCKYVRFECSRKVVEDTYVITLKSNRLADLKHGLPTYTNPNYRFFVKNQHNQLEQIFNDDQQLCIIKDKNGKDVIMCEIVRPDTP